MTTLGIPHQEAWPCFLRYVVMISAFIGEAMGECLKAHHKFFRDLVERTCWNLLVKNHEWAYLQAAGWKMQLSKRNPRSRSTASRSCKMKKFRRGICILDFVESVYSNQAALDVYHAALAVLQSAIEDIENASGTVKSWKARQGLNNFQHIWFASLSKLVQKLKNIILMILN